MSTPLAPETPLPTHTGITGALWNVKDDTSKDYMTDIVLKLIEISKSMLVEDVKNIGVRVMANNVRLDPPLTEKKWSDIIGLIQGKLPEMEVEDITSHITRCLEPHKTSSIESLHTDEKCSICLDSMAQEADKPSSTLKIPCNHLFHYECISQWMIEQSKEKSLAKSNTNILATCPICRYTLLGEEESLQHGSHQEEQVISS